MWAVIICVPPVVCQYWTVSTKFCQWHSSVGYTDKQTPVALDCGTVSTKFFQLCSNVPGKYLRVPPIDIPMYTGPTSAIPVTFECTLDQPVYTGLAHYYRTKYVFTTYLRHRAKRCNCSLSRNCPVNLPQMRTCVSRSRHQGKGKISISLSILVPIIKNKCNNRLKLFRSARQHS